MTANNIHMVNRNETPPARDAALPDKIFSANKLVQVYFAKLVYRNEHPEARDIPEEELIKRLKEWSDRFQAWYISEEGQRSIREYAERHTQDQIDLLEDMGDLTQKFLRFTNSQAN